MSATAVRNVIVLDQWLPFAQTVGRDAFAHGYRMRQFARMIGISLAYLIFIETASVRPPVIPCY